LSTWLAVDLTHVNELAKLAVNGLTVDVARANGLAVDLSRVEEVGDASMSDGLAADMANANGLTVDVALVDVAHVSGLAVNVALINLAHVNGLAVDMTLANAAHRRCHVVLPFLHHPALPPFLLLLTVLHCSLVGVVGDVAVEVAGVGPGWHRHGGNVLTGAVEA